MLKSFLVKNDFTILLSLYFLLLPIGKTLWYPLLVMAIIGFVLLFKEFFKEGISSGTKWLLLGGSFIWIPAIFSLINSVDFLRTLQFVATYPLFFLAGYFLYKRISDGVAILPVAIIISIIVILWGGMAIWQYVDPDNPFGPGGSHNQGIHTSNNPFVDGGLMMGVILGSLFSFLIFSFWARGSRIFAVLIGVFIICLVYISGTRSAWLSVLLTLFLIPLIALVRGYKPSAISYLISILLFVTISIAGTVAYQQPGLHDKLNQTLTVFYNPTREGLDRTLSGRLDIWEDAIKIGVRNPIFGTGANNFRFAQPLLPDLSGERFIHSWNKGGHEFRGATHTHQILLEAWSGAGGLGLLGILMYFFWLTITSIKVFKVGSLIAVGALISLWAGFIPFNTHNNFYGGWMTAWFWVWMGISAGFIYRQGSKNS